MCLNYNQNQKNIAIMLTNFLKSGLSSLESMSFASMGGQNQKGQPAIPLEKIVEETLAALNIMLSDRLGENIDGQQLKELTTQILKSKSLQSSLLQTKQRYNDLVNKSTILYQQARRISNSIGQFITSINMFLESDELLVPLNEIQKGINELIPDKVEKQINYLVKIFANNFQEIIDKNVRAAERSMGEEIKLMKNLNKNLQSQIIAIKNHKNNDQSKYLEQAMRITALNEKIVKLTNQKSEVEKQQKQGNSHLQDKVKVIAEQEQEIKRLKQRQGELIQKIKQIQMKSMKVQKKFKESNTESEELNTIIERLKQREEEVVEEIEAEYKKKESLNQSLRKKLCNEKAMLEEKVERITERMLLMESEVQVKNSQNQQLQKELAKYKDSDYIMIEPESEKQGKTESPAEGGEQKEKDPGSKSQKITVKELITRMSALQSKNKDIESSLQKERELNVNKQVLKSLFLNYDDQSKEWAVRRNIKYQIYSLLDLKDKMPKPQDPKSGKWFGLF